MDANDKQNQGGAGDAPVLIHIPVTELVVEIWRRRRLVAMVTGLGMLLAIGFAFLLPNEYASTVALMPPDPGAFSSPSVLNALTMGPGSALPSMSGSLMNVRTQEGTLIGLLKSRIAQTNIIDRFDLRRVYHCQTYDKARAKLTNNTEITEDKPSGIVSVTVTDPDKNRARDIAAGYVDEAVKLISNVSASSAHTERIFLEDRLSSIKSDIDANSSKLSSFSSRNATVNPQAQGEALIEASSKLQAELITAQSELYALKAQYSDDNVRVRQALARVDELQSQLRKMGGAGEDMNGANLKANQGYPSLRELPILGVTYSDLSRQLAMEVGVYEILNKQYELAKVEEAKEIPTIKVLDPPVVAEHKSSPHRAEIILIGTLLSAFIGLAWIIARTMWVITDDSQPLKSLALTLMHSGRVDHAAGPN